MLSEERAAVLSRDVAFYSRLDSSERARFAEKLNRFIDTKHIVGKKGVEVDERVRTLVAAPASRLALNLVAERYCRLTIVSVFPTSESLGGRQGTAKECFSVELALDALERGLKDGSSGENVGYHEFAHVLDASDGIMDGIPPLLLNPRLRGLWGRTLGEVLKAVRTLVEADAWDVLKPGAAKDEAELFAYATEAFFETPQAFQRHYPAFYRLLAIFYRQNPVRARSKRAYR